MRQLTLPKGTEVAFRIREAFCPTAVEVAEQITPELEIRGQVVFLSDSGTAKDHFAIVEVEGLTTPVIVPVSKVRHTREKKSAVA